MTLNLDGWMTLFFVFWLMVTGPPSNEHKRGKR